MNLYYDSLRFGIPVNQDYYESMLCTSKMILGRIWLLDKCVKRACFVVFADFLNREFKDFESKRSENKWIEKGIRENNFNLWYKASIFK